MQGYYIIRKNSPRRMAGTVFCKITLYFYNGVIPFDKLEL